MTKLFDSSCCPVSLGSRLLNSLLHADDFLLLSESAEKYVNQFKESLLISSIKINEGTYKTPIQAK
jgi:hypothetical protein